MGKLPTLGPLESIDVSGLSVVFGETYNTGILQVWYFSIDTHFILFPVEFEDGLSIPVLQNRATYPKNMQPEIKFPKANRRLKCVEGSGSGRA
jgi:hypothetical protein